MSSNIELLKSYISRNPTLSDSDISIRLGVATKSVKKARESICSDIQVNEVKNKVFNGYKKSCHTLCKFDSNTEKIFAIILENDKDVLKWLRPSPRQFNIYYGTGGISRYEPDFIVETAKNIYMVETKASNELQSKEVLEKAEAAKVYCMAASDWNKDHAGKPWSYLLISHDEVRINSSFKYLAANKVPDNQLTLDFE